MTKIISKVSAATHGYIHLDFEDGSMAVIKPVDYELKAGDSYPVPEQSTIEDVTVEQMIAEETTAALESEIEPISESEEL